MEGCGTSSFSGGCSFVSFSSVSVAVFSSVFGVVGLGLGTFCVSWNLWSSLGEGWSLGHQMYLLSWQRAGR